MVATKGPENDIIFTWVVVDRDAPLNKCTVCFHSGGRITFRVNGCNLNVANARVLGNMMRNHVVKKFSTGEAVKKEYESIKNSLKAQYENA